MVSSSNTALSTRHTLFPRHQQLPPAMEQQRDQEEAQPEAPEPHRGGPGQHPQCPVQKRSHTVARSSALLHRLPGQPHVFLSALPQSRTLCPGPQHPLGLLCPSQERPDQYSTTRSLCPQTGFKIQKKSFCQSCWFNLNESHVIQY